jgi:hypothetical protein
VDPQNLVPEIEYHETSSDGRDVFVLRKFFNQESEVEVRSFGEKPGEIKTQKKRLVRNPNAQIYSGEVPPPGLQLSSPIWLAYCSHCYLEKSKGSSRLRQIWEFDDSALEYKPDFTLPATWKVSKGIPHLPEYVAYFNDGQYYAEDNGQSVVQPLEPPFQDGFTNGLLTVLTTTNIYGLQLPAHFQFRRFAPKPAAKTSTDIAVITLIEGRAETFTTNLEQTAFPPALPDITSIRDYRFLGATPVTLVTTSWVSKADMKERRDVQLQLRPTRQKNTVPPQ